MTILHNIRTVAKYEAKTLRRSWFFRLFTLGALFVFSIMNLALFSPIGDEPWEFISIPASVPMVNLYILNLGQAIVVIFLAADFLKKDKKLDTNEVLYTRSMSNFEYVTGKTWGILRLFLGIDILILCIGLSMNIISKSMSVDLYSYLAYLLIICVPTIVFSLGLAFMLMSLIRNQAVTFMILLGIAALNIFWLWFRMGLIFDYMAFGVPILKSSIIGFDNPGFIICQRLLFFFLGLAFVMITILLFNRLPQSRLHNSLAIILLILFISGAAISGYKTYSVYSGAISDRNLAIEANRQYENEDFTSITDASIDFIHNGESIEASVNLSILNDNREPVRKYLFSLNPSLKIREIKSGGRDLKFIRVNNIIDIDPGKPLNPGENDSLIISYSGTVNESFCYPDYTDNLKDDPYRIDMLSVNKRQTFLTDEYVLLTPETHWYPVAGLNYYPSNPARAKIDFTRFALRVKTKDNLSAVSQGKMQKRDGYFYFNPENPLTGLTLAIGNYISESLEVDSVEYITYFYPGHDYYKQELNELGDTLSFLVSGIMRELETNFSTKYPFKTLSFVEVPVQYFSFPKKNTQTRAEVQPSLVLLPEKMATLDQAGFKKRLVRQKRNNERNNQVVTDKELQVRLFNSFIRNIFISVQNFRYNNGVLSSDNGRYLLGPSFYYFKNNFYSADYPAINAVFESHLQKMNIPGAGVARPQDFGNLSDNDNANLILRNLSFSELLLKNPGNDTLRTVLTLKGDYLFNLIRSRAGISDFNNWFQNYVEENKFERIDIEVFNRIIKDKYGFEFYPYLDNWYNVREQPGFLISNLQASEIVINDRIRFRVSFIASNTEPVAGLFNVAFRTGADERTGQTGPLPPGMAGGSNVSVSMQGRGMETGDISKIIFLGPGEAKRIGVVLDAQPREVMINTLFSKNLPGEIVLPVGEIQKSKSFSPTLPEEEIVASVPSFEDPSEIIVDNEDPGFDSDRQIESSPLKKLLNIENKSGDRYMQVSMMNFPMHWQPVVESSYYGKFIRSAVYTRAGTGDRSVKWAALTGGSGFYNIYCFIGKSDNMGAVRVGGSEYQYGSQQESSPYGDLHYKIYHDEGVEEISVDYGNADNGWNILGRYYLSSDTLKVELTNQSEGRLVIGDAVKWVKTD